MAMNRGIVIVSFGKREHLWSKLVSDIRRYDKETTVILITDQSYKPVDVECFKIKDSLLHWKDSKRWPIRNCNLQSAHASLNRFESCLCLNDDMRIVSPDFVDGFDMAEKFGVCVPINPRVYVKYNAMGADTSGDQSVGPKYATACNVSPMYVCREVPGTGRLIRTYIDELYKCMRGTLAFTNAVWKTGIHPVYLPEQWCVCESSARFIRDLKKPLRGKTYDIEPIMLHCGQTGVREAFKEMLNAMDRQ